MVFLQTPPDFAAAMLIPNITIPKSQTGFKLKPAHDLVPLGDLLDREKSLRQREMKSGKMAYDWFRPLFFSDIQTEIKTDPKQGVNEVYAKCADGKM